MPLYTYRREDGTTFDYRQKFTDEALKVDPVTGDPAVAAPPFARADGGEFGVRTVAIRGLQTTATLWYLGFDSELIYVGDSGSTEEGPASRRYGLEITNYVYPNRWTSM